MLMQSYWPAVARGDGEAPPAVREWAIKLEAKPKAQARTRRISAPREKETAR